MEKNILDSEEVLKRLNVLIALNLQSLSKKKEELDARGQIAFLSNLKLKANDIADILGKTVNYVNKELFYIRKNKK